MYERRKTMYEGRNVRKYGGLRIKQQVQLTIQGAIIITSNLNEEEEIERRRKNKENVWSSPKMQREQCRVRWMGKGWKMDGRGTTKKRKEGEKRENWNEWKKRGEEKKKGNQLDLCNRKCINKREEKRCMYVVLLHNLCSYSIHPHHSSFSSSLVCLSPLPFFLSITLQSSLSLALWEKFVLSFLHTFYPSNINPLHGPSPGDRKHVECVKQRSRKPNPEK